MARPYSFETFIVKNGRKIHPRKVICYTISTPRGFNHYAVLEGSSIEAKAVYYSRTWESYKYETVLSRLQSKLDDEYAYLNLKIYNGGVRVGK